MSKSRIESIILKHHNKDYKRHVREQKRANSKKKKNESPEKAVEKECLLWMRKQGWDVEIYESKAKWNATAGRYLADHLKVGTSDCQGVTSYMGIACFVEFKAPGKCSTFNRKGNEPQQNYLKRKIELGAFGVVVDSADMLERLWKQYLKARVDLGMIQASHFLMEQLPKRRQRNAPKDKKKEPSDAPELDKLIG